MRPPRISCRRSPSQLRPGLLSRALLAAFLGAALAGCESDPGTADWTTARTPSEPQVQTTDFRHDVPFAAGRPVPAPGDEAALRRFVFELGTDPQDRIYVLAAAPRPGDVPSDDLITRQRQAAVVRTLAELGLATDAARTAAENLEPGRPVAVLVRRTRVTLPNCPDWSGDPGSNTDNRPLRNWSCSSAVNLGMMVVEPNDLVLGRSPGPANGEYLARSMENYRKGRTRDLIRDVASGELFPTVVPTSSSGN